jgi:Leucine-rich repeat (LRR) protein
MKPSKLSDYFKKEQSTSTRLELSFKEISVLDTLPFRPISIVHLDISFNNLASLEGIEQFPSLTFLNISNNHLRSLLCLSSIKRKELLTHLQIRGNPASHHPNLIPILFNYFPNIVEVDAEPVSLSISKDIMQAMELSSSLIPYLYINEQLILKIHRDIQFLHLKFELFEATWGRLPVSVLPSKSEVKTIHARFVHKYPEILYKTIEGKIRPAHLLDFMQGIKEQININSAHLEEETVCKIYRWLYCEIVLQLHGLGNVDLQCFLQTYEELSIHSSHSVYSEEKIDGITSDLMKFSQLSHYPQSLLHFPVFGSNTDYMKALYRVLVKQVTVVQSLIRERKGILMMDLKEVCDEVQSPPSKISYPSLHSYEYCSPSLLRDFVSPTVKSPTEAGGFLSPKFRLEATQSNKKQQIDFNREELVMKLDFEDESELNITNSYDELSQTIEELLRDDDEEKYKRHYLKKILIKAFFVLKKKRLLKRITVDRRKVFLVKIIRTWKKMTLVDPKTLEKLKIFEFSKKTKTKTKCFQVFKSFLPNVKNEEISTFFYQQGLKLRTFRGFFSILKARENFSFFSLSFREKHLLKKCFRGLEHYLKVVVTQRSRIRQHKLKTMKILIKKILKSWLYLVRPSAKFLKKSRPESTSDLDKLLLKLQKKDAEVIRTFKKFRKPGRSLKLK